MTKKQRSVYLTPELDKKIDDYFKQKTKDWTEGKILSQPDLNETITELIEKGLTI